MTAIVTTADGEFEYEPTSPYVLSQPDDEWCYAIVRTEDGEVLGSDGWQQMGVVEDATFTRDLKWIVPELNRLAGELAEARSLLAHAACPTCDDRGWYVEPGHACRNEQECMERCPEPVQVQCEWCDRRATACNGSEVPS